MSTDLSPQQAWDDLAEGNRRFVAGDPRHPNQGVDTRHTLEAGQSPKAIFFGCGDSRVAAEIIFDQGLGDLFVVRTAGHVLGAAVLGSIEFGVEVLGVPLIVVLGHDSCGAVKATMQANESGNMPPGFIREIVERVMPSAIAAKRAGDYTADAVCAENVRMTAALLRERSVIIRDALDEGRLAVVGATYQLDDGSASVVVTEGQLEA